MGGREGELAGSGGEAGEATQPRAAPAHGQLDEIVDADGGGSDRGGAQPALAAAESTAAAPTPIATQTAPHSPAMPSAFIVPSIWGVCQRVRMVRSRRRSSSWRASSTGRSIGPERPSPQNRHGLRR